ncbi:CHASE2 domain-containing protein [Desulfobacter latus]|uniref:CHASE2 domain-containing protein n=1 Tax=Desulfobacter latus TaxID=2292 RepID=UPI0015B4DEF5|nr:adenylate/guanylate cyclase domain-containing protein [Desulfobacter latus]
MNFGLKNKKDLKFITVLGLFLLWTVSAFWFLGRGNVWSRYNFQMLDSFYRYAVQSGHGPPLSPKIAYVLITNDSYDYVDKNILDRAYMAKVNDVLNKLGVAALAYDIIFARPGKADADQCLVKSIQDLGNVYLPIGLDCSNQKRSFKWETGSAYERFRFDYLFKPIEKGESHPFYAVRALMQADKFSRAAFNSGHISAMSDPDGVFRHNAMLLRVDDSYFPTLSLSMFLDYAGISFDEITVHWGEKIVIPATKHNFLETDIIIPIDNQGRTFIPYAQDWHNGFKKMGIHTLLQYYDDKNLRGNLTDFFEGKFVFIGDVSSGISDLGQTPLEHSASLIEMHTALLNGLLTHSFYAGWSFEKTLGFILAMGTILVLSAFLKPPWIFYGTGCLVFAAVIGIAWFDIIQFSLVPVFTIFSSTGFIFLGLIIGSEIIVSKDRAFIKSAFSRYVPEKVVLKMLSNPELLNWGGEERIITVLFADLENFTAISEKMKPADLVTLLNDYLTEMTDIVLAQGGIIDKYQGDSIMAEFGAPFDYADHADRAVKAGLAMQQRLKTLRSIWRSKGLPELRCRVGINTGPMIIGNLGSRQIFDYTVIGDAVNLASRLEGANKYYNTYLMISEFTHAALTPGMFLTRILDSIKVKGKKEAVNVFEVYGTCSENSNMDHESYYQIYNHAFETYLVQEFACARDLFLRALSLRPDDPASKNMITRIDSIVLKNKMPINWDGSIALTEK